MAPACRIGFLVDGLLSRYQVHLFDAVRKAAWQRGALVVGFPGSYLGSSDTERPAFDGSFVYDLVSPSSVDGIIVASNLISSGASAAKIRSICEHGTVPVVSIGPQPGVTVVDVDNGRGLHRVIDHLITDHGCRHLALIRGPVTNPDSLERERVFRSALESHGLEIKSDLIVTGTFLESSGAAAVRALFDERQISLDELDAIVAANDQMANGAMQELAARGIRVPEDVLVVGFDDDDHARSACPPLTTVAQPITQLGEVAVDLLMAKIRGERPVQALVLQTLPVLRRSCGCSEDRCAPSQAQPSAVDFDTYLEDRCSTAAEQLVWFGADERARLGIDQVRAYLLADTVQAERESLRQLERIVLDLSASGIDPLRWQDALAAVFQQSAQWATFDPRQQDLVRFHIERLKQLFAELASAVARKDQLRTVELANSLRVVGSAVVCARNLRALGRVLDAGLPSLDIRYCCVCTFTSPERSRARVSALYFPLVPKPHAQIQSAEQLWRSVPPTLPPGAAPSSLGEQSFPASALLPPNSRPIGGDLLAFPLMFGDEALGFVILDAPRNSERAWLLEGLSGHLSSAIYEIRRTEQLRLAREQAEEANSAKTTFVATMSHEVRTPLNAILGNLDLCLRTELTKKQRKQLLRVQTSSRALRSIIDDILDYSRIEANRVDLESVPFDLESVLEQVISTCATEASRKNLEFVLDVDCRVPARLFGDPLRLSQILLNLVNNAIKFSTLGFVALRVTRVGEREDTSPLQLQFSVEDTGIGIGPDHIARIFHPFTQADSSMTRRYGGTGLGLTICQRLVELMGGELSVRSVIGSGSTFEFTLPFSTDTDAVVGSASVPAKIVLALENSAQMGALTRLLEDLGHQVIPVHTGKDARRALAELGDMDSACFLFADHRLSDMTGPELLAQIREHDLSPNLRLVQLVPYDSDCLLSGGWHTGAGEAILVKPPLRSSVERLLRSDSCRVSSAPPRSTRTDQSLCGKRILVVQDSEMSRELIVDILSLSGAEVQTAVDGEEAIRRVFQEHFDLVLMDLHLPMMDGWAASRAIREQYVQTVLPILALSATSVPEDRARCLDAGMNDFLRAPIGAVELVDAVHRWLSPQSTHQVSPAAPLPPTGARAGSGGTQILEVARALGRLGGNQALYRQLLRRFVQTHATASDDMARLFDQSDYPAAANLVHVLVSAAGNIGATRLLYAAQALEVALRNAHVSRIIAARPRFDAEWLASLQAVQNTLERYSDASQPPNTVSSPGLTQEHIEQLQKLLSEHDTAAVELVDRLRESFVGDPQTEHALRQLAHSVSAYDFDAAQSHLGALASSLCHHSSERDTRVAQKPNASDRSAEDSS